MSKSVDKLLSLATQYEQNVEKFAKTDPKAEVRNRGKVVFPAESSKDKQDHFPINDAAQARNALSRVHQYNSVPPWYSGTLKSLQEAVSRAVKKHYKDIDVAGKGKKASSKSSLIRKASSDDFFPIVQNYDTGTEPLIDYISAMNRVVDVFVKESGGLNNLSPQSEKIAHVLYLQAKLLEKVLPEMKALDAQLYSAMEEPSEDESAEQTPSQE
jgi:hypothetical protein